MISRMVRLSLALLLACVLFAAGAAGAAELATVSSSPNGLSFEPAGEYGPMTLTVSGPTGVVTRHDFAAGVEPVLEVGDLAAGTYMWELRAQPILDAATRAALARARKSGDESIVHRLRASGKLPAGELVQSGSFGVRAGALVDPGAIEPRAKAAGSAAETRRSETTGVRASEDRALTNLVAEDFVIGDDLIVQGSACIGLDCVNNEVFDFDTVRLKENNLRIKFQDTSTIAGFPTRDWQLTANDSASGGANKFSIEDVDVARVPFTLISGAPSNSLFVDSAGRVGFGTATPVLSTHVASGNTPALRLDQTAASGFTPQVWDVAGNEANFFIRDATNASRLPLRIQPGAASNSLFINNVGNVGVGTSAPAASLQVTRTDGTTQLLVRETTATNGNRQLLRVENSTGNVQSIFVANSAGTPTEWRQNWRGADFRLNVGGGTDLLILDNPTGNLTVTGSVTGTTFIPSSDRELKENFAAVDADEILDRLVAIPVSRWNFKDDPHKTPHLGAVAQDFYAAFGVGADDKHISTTDADGVTVAAIQALNARLLSAVERLEARNAALEARLAALEASEP